LQDIYKPDSARLRRHLSAIINFAKFREEKLVAYTEMQGRIDELAAAAAAAQAAHDAQVEALQQLKEERAAEEEVRGWWLGLGEGVRCNKGRGRWRQDMCAGMWRMREGAPVVVSTFNCTQEAPQPHSHLGRAVLGHCRDPAYKS
jgi:hypothetical protein